ncbi:MAG: DNA (cytosine-5-)-methyltransferase [Clostridium sp.]|nr:DNA (cytosine-5-)-methyltransferase [Clostridium sp.]
MIRLATLFSGIGAVEQALIRMNKEYKIVFACDNGDIDIDIDTEEIRNIVFNMKSKKQKKDYVDDLYKSKSRKQNYVKQSYLANYDINEEDFYADVRFLDGKDYKGKVDLLVGGSPCQSFSTVGYQGGLDDVRGTLFYEYARIVKETQPKVFIYENVRGLTTHDNGKTWEKMKKIFTETLHYKITEPQILNAADYGIPQNRRRLFVIGIRDDIECKQFNYPQPIGIDNLPFYMQDILEDNCKYDEKKLNYNFDKKSGKIIINKEKGTVDKKYILTPKVRDYCLKTGTKNFRTSTQTDLPIARTLLRTMTQHHRAGVDNYITVKEYKTTKDIRSLTERECLRLMGYPDSFKIVVSTQQMMKQAGNSIVVDVMMALLKEIFRTGAL